ncbi:hypothetical protein N825_18690 [Skermanella stibiiresistens SB22]|uniref:Uncharacterized protein n=1 Tax=Skermanella stibiiresistens SB22 TaxID=1385369 RepID=W9HC63_9PROT|nr:hypothetical protein [Skermanella stibiiresistens]EWY42316.1 hypothetical protein N825_18690 [Skermanella stibiiresistens SB22]
MSSATSPETSSRQTLRRAITAATAACVLAASSSAWAKSVCYSPAEYDAEQAMRLHTELMVIGLTCNSVQQERKLFAKYQEFTTKHRVKLMGWEKTLIGHFRQTDKANPTRKFDDFRTVLANEIAQRAALLTPPVFCQSHSDRVDQAIGMSDGELTKYLSNDVAGQIGEAPPCGVAVAELLEDDGAVKVAQVSKKAPVQGKKADKASSQSKPAKTAAPAKTASAKPAKTIVTAAKVD